MSSKKVSISLTEKELVRLEAACRRDAKASPKWVKFVILMAVLHSERRHILTKPKLTRKNEEKLHELDVELGSLRRAIYGDE